MGEEAPAAVPDDAASPNADAAAAPVIPASAPAPAPAPATPPAAAIRNNALSARELSWANNPPDLLQKHAEINGTIVRTRFPPEPNGYLHIGHAKSMNMNFSLAFDKLNVLPENRRTVFRYDDTNPDAESKEYIDSLAKDVEWLGWTPERTTYSSDNFQTLHDLAVQLITKGLAYCCDMTKGEMEIQRELAMKRANARNVGKDPDIESPISSPDVLPGKNRNTSIARNLQIFRNMRLGMYDEGRYTLRLKMDFESSNPNMYDLVAYRIKYTPHPHAGPGWCIYPAYDFTHGICDSLEHIDYSICTLEFETRREPYYWILWALDMFRPAVYEMSRLNLQYTVLSKRRLLKLVTNGHVRGWDDPRMPTISGYRRRGFTAGIINQFCTELGATRAANVIEMEKLYHTARLSLGATTRRAMAVLEPILVTISNWDDKATIVGDSKDSPPTYNDSNGSGDGLTFEVQNSPTDPTLGCHPITLERALYIDASDFRMVDSDDYFGLAPNKAVGLKYYGGNLTCHEVVMAAPDGKDGDAIKELKCTLDHSTGRVKPKTYIGWVPAVSAIPCEVRLYNHLFTVPEPTDTWEEELNPESEIVYPNAYIDPSVRELVDSSKIDPWQSNQALQFERMGYFVVDVDSTYDSTTGEGKLVFNRTVSLKEETFKKKATNTLSKQDEVANDARRLKQKADLEAKEARMKIDPKDLFRTLEEYTSKYSKFDSETGLPTHATDGTELTKSTIKKLKKDQEKHAKQLSQWKKK